jgi:hypothetical protein
MMKKAKKRALPFTKTSFSKEGPTVLMGNLRSNAYSPKTSITNWVRVESVCMPMML